MKIRIDSHTHSLASGHAYSTIDDLARGARRAGLSGFVLTDHGPSMPGGPHRYHFGNLRTIPRRLRGVRFYAGTELNIMDLDGRVDLPASYCANLDFVMAGLHEICLEPMSAEENTRALVAALRNPLVDAVSHPGNIAFPADLEAVVAAAAEEGKAVELNDGTFRVRRGSEANCLRVARLCAEKGALVCCGSDAHYWKDVGRFDHVMEMIEESGLRKAQIVNASPEAFDAFVERRRAARGEAASRTS